MDETEGQSKPGADQEASTRRRILDAAQAEFAELGKAGARVDRIASRAGVNKAMLYYHFGNKDQLYLTVIEDFFDQVSAFIREHTEPETTLEGVLGGMANAYAALFERIHNFRPVLLRELAEADSPAVERIAGVFRDSGIGGKVREVINGAVGSGNVRDVDVRQAAVSFIAMNIGYIMAAPMMNRVFGIADPQAFIEQRREAVVDIFLNGLLTR